MQMAIMISFAAVGFTSDFSDSAATLEEAATPSGPSAARYATFANRYIAIKASVPIKKARGKLRCGFMISPALNVPYCQPSYAHKTLTIARPKPEASEPFIAAGQMLAPAPSNPCPHQSNAALIRTMAVTLMAVVQFCTSALVRVPRTLTAVTTTIIASETAFAASGDMGTTVLRLSLKATASVATVPALIAKKSVHPNRNAGIGPKQSRMCTYRPPAFGLTALNSP